MSSREAMIEEARKFLRDTGEYDDDYRCLLLADFALLMIGDKEPIPDVVGYPV